MPKFSSEEIMKVLSDESWMGLSIDKLQELERSIQIHVDNGYEVVGKVYDNNYDELSSVSKKEIELFAGMLRMQFPKRHSLQVLDVGAGHGVRSVYLSAQDKINLKAIEPSDYFYARHLLELEKEGKLPFGCAMKGDMCDLPFENATFDGIYCNAVLHHQLYLSGKNIGIEKAFSEFSRIIMKEGKLFLSTLYGDKPYFRQNRFFQSLNEESMQRLAKRNSFIIDSMEQLEGVGPFGEKTKWLYVYLTKRPV